MDNTDRRLVTLLQDGIPVCERPFDTVAGQLGITVDDVLGRLQVLLDDRVLSRFGPLYNAERLGGTISLCAMQVEPGRFDEVAMLVNAHPEVAHNYEREHALNMWFVVATESPEQHSRVLESIGRDSGCRVYDMPKLQEYFLDLRLPA